MAFIPPHIVQGLFWTLVLFLISLSNCLLNQWKNVRKGILAIFDHFRDKPARAKGANKNSNDQTNYYVFEPTSKGTKMTITMDYKMNMLLDVLVARRMIEKANMETLEKLKKVLEA